MGVVLQVLESGDALAPLLEAGAPAGLILVDQDAATSATLRALGRSRIGASMNAMPMIALADAPTEDDMRACLRAGAIDMVPRAFAHHFLHTLCERLLNDRGQAQVDTKLQIAAIDSKRAMSQMQSDAPFFGSLLRAFFEELPARAQQLQDDWVLHPQHIKHQCHALKGLAMTLGLHQLAEVAMRTEAQATQTTALDGSLLVQLAGEMQSAGFQILRWLKLHQDVLEVVQ
jgi:HPt (histidine-containing phosphotransfer) domain-containing protein